jgi:fluoroquinolone resistance protein
MVTGEIRSQNRYADRSFKQLRLTRVELVSCEFHNCLFTDCSLVETVLRSCRVVNCTFRASDLSLLQVSGTAFATTCFQGSKLVGIDWTCADWSSGKLAHPLAFDGCSLNHSTLIGLELPGLEITGCTALDVDFREADLSGADFSGTDLTDSLFSRTDLTGADLSRARNYHINPQENILRQAKFSLPEAISLLYSLDIVLVDQAD